MPDISMCRNIECKLHDNCYRFKAEPNPYWQAYAQFEPYENGECDYFWNYDEYMKTD